MMNAQHWVVVYFLIAAIDLTLILLGEPFYFRLFTRPVLGVILFVYTWLSISQKKETLFKLLAAVLITSVFADALMLFHIANRVCFLLGILFLWVQQILYAFLFYYEVQKQGKKLYMRGLWWRIPLAVIVMALSVNLLWDGMGTLRFYLLIFGFFVLIRISTAVGRLHAVSDASFFSVIFGSMLFVIACLIFGVDKFVVHLPMAILFSAATYIIGQFLVVNGILHQMNLETEPEAEAFYQPKTD